MALCAFTPPALCQTQGRIQLSIPSPEPSKAGETVTFQTIIVNQGTEIWKKDEYWIEIEMYDADKKYIAKLERMKGKTSINPAESIITYADFEIPSTYGGEYFYKVFLSLNGNRIAQSEDYHRFNVIAAAPLAPKDTLKVSGNLTLAFRNTDKYGWNNYIGNISLNAVAQAWGTPSLLNIYTFHTPESTSTAKNRDRLYNILFSNYGASYSLYLGDVMPSFSNLGLYGCGMRGVYLNKTFDAASVEAVGSQITEAKEGTADISGAYQRVLTGCRVKFNPSDRLSLGANLLSGNDNKDSILQPGPGVTPAKDSVYGPTVNYRFGIPLELDCELMFSEYAADTGSPVNSRDSAYRTELKYNSPGVNSRLQLQEVKPQFCSFGAPGTQNDRRSVDFNTSFYPNKQFEFGLGYNRWNNNLDGAADKLTTTQQIYRTNLAYRLSETGPSSVYFAFLYNEAAADTRAAQDNFTQTVSLGFNSMLGRALFSVNLQQVGFTDSTEVSSDLMTNTLGVFINSPLSGSASLGMGMNFTGTNNLSKQFLTGMNSVSANITCDLLPGRLTSQFWTTYNSQSNNAADAADRADRNSLNLNLEFSLRVRSSLNLIAGIIYNSEKDIITPANDLVENGFSTRMTYSF